MCVRIDSGGDAEKYSLCHSALLCLCGEGVKLVLVVYYERSNLVIKRKADIRLGLVVAVEIDLFCGEACSCGCEYLARGHAVNAESLLGSYLVYSREAERL